MTNKITTDLVSGLEYQSLWIPTSSSSTAGSTRVSLKKFAASNNNRIISFFRKRLTSNKEISHLENEIKTNFDQIVFGNEEEKEN